MDSKRIRKKVKEDYNQIAGEFSSTRKHAWKDFELFRPYVNDGDHVMDLGCGNGRLLLFLKGFKLKSYLGVDQSEGLLKQARRIHPKAKFEEMDFAQLPEGKKDKDLVFAIASFHHLAPKDQVNALKQWRSHLKPGGHLLMTNWNLHQKRYRVEVVKSLWSGYGFRGCLIPWRRKVMRFYYAFTLRRLNKILKQAGYRCISNKYVSDGKSSSIWSAKNIITIAQA